jgi:hypothetical protein
MRYPDWKGVVRQVQTRIDPPGDGYDGFDVGRYHGYPVTMIVRGKRVTVFAYD